MEQLEKKLAELFSKAPHLSEKIRLIFVKIAPWVTLIAIILVLPILLAILGLSAVALPLSFLGVVSEGSRFGLGTIFLILGVVLEAMALPGLFKRTRRGWEYSFYATLLSGIQYILDFNLGSLVIGTGLSLYILFEIRSYYGSAPNAASPTMPSSHA